jgi:MFS family permease
MSNQAMTSQPSSAPSSAPSATGRSGQMADRVRLSHGAGFWVIAAAFLVVMAFSTLPTPIYSLYQARDGFATYVITVIFAAYAVGVMASLYLAGHVSDWLGRRRIILASILLEVLAAVIFLTWRAVPGLIVARVLSGAGVGTLTATATAHLSELRGVSRPDEGRSRATLVSTAVNMGGLALGPLIAGALLQFVRSPLTVPYLVFLILLTAAALAVALVPETVERREERPAYRPQRVSLPASARSTFWAAGGGAFGGFAILGLFTSLAPTFVAGTMHQHSHLVAGAVPFAVFMSGAVSQVALAAIAPRRQLQIGLALMVVGLVAVGTSGQLPSLLLFIVGGVLSGAGVGLVFRSAIGTAAGLASPESRGEVLAAIFLVAYTGLAVPVLLVGIAVAHLSAATVLLVFSAAVLALVLWSGTRMLTRRAA